MRGNFQFISLTLKRNGAEMSDDSTERLLVIGTGGTIEKVYDPVRENNTFAEIAAIDNILTCSRFNDFDVIRPLTKDSLHMQESDRSVILSAIENSSAQHILIVHGTSTIIETAEFLHDAEAVVSGKTIVLTGSLYPAEMRKHETAFNVGFAVAIAAVVEHGVYVAMHGIFGKYNEIYKDPDSGTFMRI